MISSCLEIREKKEPQWKLFLKIISCERRNTLHSRYRERMHIWKDVLSGQPDVQLSCIRLWHLQPAPAEKQMIWGGIQATFTGQEALLSLEALYLQSCLCAIPTAQTLYSWSTVVARVPAITLTFQAAGWQKKWNTLVIVQASLPGTAIQHSRLHSIGQILLYGHPQLQEIHSTVIFI